MSIKGMFDKVKKTRVSIWTAAAVLIFLVIAVLIGIAFTGPAIGNISYGLVADLPSSSQRQLPASGESLIRLPNQNTIERLFIREGSIQMEVEDTHAARDEIKEFISAMAGEGAFIVSSSERGGYEPEDPVINMIIRVPAEEFDNTMEFLEHMAVEVEDRSENAEDVTEEYVDLRARLESMEVARRRLLDIMGNAQTTEALLQAEQQLTQREAEIESIKGRMQFLSDSAALSKIEIMLTPYLLSQPLATGWQPAEVARRAFDGLVNSIQGFASFLIYFSIAILPWLILIVLVWYAFPRLKRRWSTNEQGEQQVEE